MSNQAIGTEETKLHEGIDLGGKGWKYIREK